MLSKSLPALIVLFGTAFSSLAACTGHADLNNYERGQFIEVAYGARAQVYAQFLSQLGCGEQMLGRLQGLGAIVRYADERSGYALVMLPRGKVLDTLDIEGIEYAYTRDDDRLYYQDPVAKVPQDQRKPEPVPPIAIPYPRVAMTLPKDGPYFEADAIRLAELWKEHPDADGHGVRVGVADEGFDLLHPELQKARDAVGKIVPKVADLGTLTTPEEDSGWVRFGEPIRTMHDTFQAAGRTWIAPQDGIYRFGIFQQNLFLGPEYNSHTKKLALSVGVLWNPQSGRIWVDTDGNGSFRNERALGDYALTHDIAWFGATEGDNDNRIPYGVKIDAPQNAVYLRIGGEHGAFVAGALAGNEFTGGLFNGAAPGAQLIDENLTRATLIASTVKMFARPDVDVVNRSGAIGRAGYIGLKEGIEDFAQRVLERAIAVYEKPMACYCAAAGAIHVNDYAGPEMLRRNRRLAPPYKETIHSFVWWLPNGLVNTVLAPSASLETDSRYTPQAIAWEDGRFHIWGTLLTPSAPEGYVIGANNSPAIPVVSGILADLISEAKREHVRYDAARLNNAVFTGARLLDGIPASQQGYGLVNAARSWNQLVKMAKADDPKNPQLTSFTLSRMESGHSVEVQGSHADLAHPGKKLDGEIWIARHGGYLGGRKYTFALRGNDGSYELGGHEALLVRDQPLRIRFRENGAPGWHLAFLELRDAKADVVMEDVPLSVRVPDIPESVAPGVDEYQSAIQPLTSEYRYIRVDNDVQAVRYAMRIPYTGPDNISTRFFPGAHYGTTATPPGDPVDATHHIGPIETIESLVANDEPGTQEIFWENRGRPEYATQYDGPAPDAPIHAELTVAKYSLSIARRAGDTLALTNKLAEITGKAELYDATLKTASLAVTGPHASGELEETLSANLAQWRVQVASDSASSEPEDLYLLNCSGKNGCHLAAEQEISARSKTIVIDKPRAGDWRIVVRSRDQVHHPVVSYTVHEAFLVPASTPIDPANSQHASGATWTLTMPKKESDAQYAAFRIAGTPGNKREKDGLRIALTPLDADAP